MNSFKSPIKPYNPISGFRETNLIKKEANPAIGGPLTMPKEQAPAPVFQPLAPAAPMGAGFNRLKAMFARGR